MKKYFVVLTVLLAITSLVLLAADIDGTWTAETQGKGGPVTQKLVLKADGKVLKGNYDNGRGAADIAEGMVEGNNFSFKVNRDFGGKQVTQEMKGVVNSKTELKLTTQGKQGPQDITFKKAQ
jgi:hypothetical protein